MNCMKCGREIEDEQVFCSFCLQEMEHYPVKPGSVILLPPQKTASLKKASRKKKAPPTPEEQAGKLKRRVWFYRAVSFILVLAVSALIYISNKMIEELDIQRLLGQNYSSVTDATQSD